MKSIVLGGGCFWCTEAVFQRIDGVSAVLPGYAGGDKANPTYADVATGKTGHAEVVRVTYDPERVSLEHILRVFFATHDPTTLNRQGADIGTEYRSVILYDDSADLVIIEAVVRDVEAEIQERVVTEIVQLDTFYPAEDYHQNFYTQNQDMAYCQIVINPKLDKLRAFLQSETGQK